MGWLLGIASICKGGKCLFATGGRWRRWLRRVGYQNKLNYTVLVCCLNRTLAMLQRWRALAALCGPRRRAMQLAARGHRYLHLQEAMQAWRQFLRAALGRQRDLEAHAAGHEVRVLRQGLVVWSCWWLGLRDDDLLWGRTREWLVAKGFTKWRRKQQVRSRLHFLDGLASNAYAERVRTQLLAHYLIA